MKSKPVLVIGALVLLVVLVGGYLFATAPKQQGTGTETKTTVGREFTVEGSEFSFSPASISVSASEEISVTFKNVGKTRHDFTIEELGVKTKLLSPGESETVTFTAKKSGTYTFFCSVAGHRQSGMEGTVTAN